MGLRMNSCVVKYIHLKDIDASALHVTDDYEFSKAVISHSSYEEMEQRVEENCPSNFICYQPISLHHEVLWRTMLCKNENGMVEMDQLFHPIDRVDYLAIRWQGSSTETPLLSVCVHIEPYVAILA